MIQKLRKCKGFLELILKPDPFIVFRIGETVKDFLWVKSRGQDIGTALDSAMSWLAVAQDATSNGGVADAFSLFGGWGMAYPEVSGYIISTFIDYWRLSGKEEFLRRAERIADWECVVLDPQGYVRGGHVDSDEEPVIFNTSQVILGMCDIYRHIRKGEYADFIKKASDWIVTEQEHDGDWVKHEFNRISHTYNTRTCWVLLRACCLLNDEKLKDSAIKALELYLTRQLANGWYRGNSFQNEDPFLHTIAYAISGFLECGAILKEERYINSARKAADVLVELQNKEGLSGQYNEKWQRGYIRNPYYPDFKYRCLTGEAQMSIVWAKLYNMTKDEKYKKAVKVANQAVMKTQMFCPGNSNVDGSIKGSFPIYGSYMRYRFPSWAAKFFADALMLEKKLL